MKATYVSVWDGGTEVRSSCDFFPSTLNVSNIETVDVDVDDECLVREYIELPDGTEVDTFNDEDSGRTIASGVNQDETDARRAEDY